jgi:hypothetical protein
MTMFLFSPHLTAAGLYSLKPMIYPNPPMVADLHQCAKKGYFTDKK